MEKEWIPKPPELLRTPILFEESVTAHWSNDSARKYNGAKIDPEAVDLNVFKW